MGDFIHSFQVRKVKLTVRYQQTRITMQWRGVAMGSGTRVAYLQSDPSPTDRQIVFGKVWCRYASNESDAA